MTPPDKIDEQSPHMDGVDATWTFAVEPAASSPISHLVLPDGCMDLIARTHRASDGGCRTELLVAGPSFGFHVVDIPPGTSFVGMRFRTGWGGACLDVDPSALAGRVVAAETCGADLADLTNGMANASTVVAARHLHAFVQARAGVAQPERRILDSVRLLRLSGGRIGIGELAAAAGMSPRTLRREMTAAVGVAPKALARVFRFRHSLRLKASDRSLSLAAIAHEAGYADQAHMTREYRTLGGFSPTHRPKR